jgi:tripartite ATP-independent transporter DctM subunit
MNATYIGILGLAALFTLLALRMPVGIAMFLVGVVGFGTIQGWSAAFATLGQMPFEYSQSYDLSVIPLFVLMGNLCTASGASRDLFRLANAWIGHWKGGLASATVAACASFAAVSGSSLATAVTIGTVALPEMDRYKYDPRLATGAVAAGGTLGILIPPSTGFIVYGLLTEQSIGKLFLAGFIPGLVLAGLFIAAVAIMTALRPAYGPPGERASWPERAVAIARAGPMLGVAVISIGGIYVGVFTVTEAAAVGAFLTVLLVAWRSIVSTRNAQQALANFAKLNRNALRHTIHTTAMVFLILIGAQMFTPFLAVTHIPEDLAGLLNHFNLPPLATLLTLLVIYVILGMFMEGFSMLVLTIPIVFPIVTSLGFDPIWFGVIMVIVLEMGLITPPVGLNVYVIRGISPDVPMASIFVGVLPFLFAMVLCIALLIAYPQIALILPNSMIR